MRAMARIPLLPPAGEEPAPGRRPGLDPGVAGDRVHTAIVTGAPFRGILQQAKVWRADLVVMAVSGRRGLRSPYVGSETERVLEFSTCPVLVVPAGAARAEGLRGDEVGRGRG